MPGPCEYNPNFDHKIEIVPPAKQAVSPFRKIGLNRDTRSPFKDPTFLENPSPLMYGRSQRLQSETKGPSFANSTMQRDFM